MGYTGAPPTYQSFPIDYLSGDGVRTSFDLSYPASAEGSILVTINNQHVYANRYQVNNQSLVFIGYTPPAGTNNIEVLYLGLPALSEAVTGVTSVGLSTTLSGITIVNSPVITSGVIQLGGTLGVQSGGTGANVFTNYQLLVGNGSSPVTSLGSLGAAKQALISQGTGLVPSWQNVVNSFSAGSSGLTPATASTGDIVLSGTLNVATGGTGVVNFVNNRILIGNGTAPVAQVSSTGTLGQVLTSQGNNPPIWSTVAVQSVTAPPTFGITVVNTAGAVVIGGTLSIANGGTNNTTLVANTLVLGNLAGTAYTSLASPGTLGQVLTSAGAGAPPIWQDAGGTSVTTFSAGTTGLSPSFASSGVVTLSGILNVANGGTGLATLTANALLLGNGTSAITQVSGLGTTGQVLTSNGAGAAPTWQNAAIRVTTFSAGTTGLTPSTGTSGAVTLGGTLNVASGGTGVATLTANAILLGNGTAAVTQVSGVGTTGQILTSNGAGQAPTWQAAPSTQIWTNGTTPPIGGAFLAVYQVAGVASLNPNPGTTYVMDGLVTGTRLVQGTGTTALIAGTYLCLGSFINTANSLWTRIS